MTTTTAAPTGLTPYALSTEARTNPLGIDVLLPRLSWKLRSDRRGDAQTAFRITVVSESTDAVVWDTGWQESGETLHHVYGGSPLQSRVRYSWRVEVSSLDDGIGSASAWFEMGLAAVDWRAKWIARDLELVGPLDDPAGVTLPEEHLRLDPPAHLRRSFQLPSPPVHARLYATAHGIYLPHVNGCRVGDVELAPGWTEYRERVMYQTYDVTDALVAGENVLGAVLADGWWSGYVGFDPRHAARHYGRDPEFLAQLVMEFADGSSMVLCTDEEWVEHRGSITATDMLMGEYVDARRALPGWDAAGAGGSGFHPVVVTGDDVRTVVAQSDEPVRLVADVPAAEVTRIDDARQIVDLGQNIVGRVRLTIRGAARGARIGLRHAEMLENGELYVANLRSAEATDAYTAAGEDVEVFEPTFTVHGFRYVEVSHYPGDIDPSDIVGRVLSVDVPTTGSFTCSDPMVNQLQSNIEWGQRGNFVSIPTDCPQRDERLGWLADAQIFLPTATRNADVAAFFARWLRDVRSGQTADGAFHDVAPVTFFLRSAAPAWGDGGVLMPWFLYERYGDERLLDESFDSMRRWVDFVARHNPDFLWRNRQGNSYGDWLQVDTNTPRDVVATAYFARSAEVVARAAAVLGRTEDAASYEALRARIGRAYVNAFVDADGRMTCETQTSYLLSLGFGLMPIDRVDAAVAALAGNVEARGCRLTTGFLGVSLLCPVLADHGRSDLAYALLQQDAYPSWGYSIRSGATTIWERWDGWTEEKGFQSQNMNSFNHYSLGSVGEWLYAGVAGIRQQAGSVAYQHLDLRPQIGGTLTSAHAVQNTPRGQVVSAWRVADGELSLDVEVPPGVTATLLIPRADAASISEAGAPLPATPGVEVVGATQEGTVLAITSGTYSFRSRFVER